MIKIVPVLEKAAQGKPATENTNPALAILAINTLAPARGTPAVLAPLVAVSIPPAPALAAMNGKMEVVLKLSQLWLALLELYIIPMEHAIIKKLILKPYSVSL